MLPEMIDPQTYATHTALGRVEKALEAGKLAELRDQMDFADNFPLSELTKAAQQLSEHFHELLSADYEQRRALELKVVADIGFLRGLIDGMRNHH